ncbi:riboflavin synthase [Candidatus Peribacteria bacterium]|nr:riboflavin synthase [Candidatus Peribacteria bacterium]
MFTGIIEATAGVLSFDGSRLIVERPSIFTDMQQGSSIAVSGVCLSVKKLNKKCIQFDVVPETLAKTTIGSYKEGDMVNLERAMRADGRLDGHIVQGHVEGVGEAVRCDFSAVSSILVIRVPKLMLPSIVPKGSIAIDGISLTVASIDGDRITVALIPHTLENTTFGTLHVGDRVNIETDILARYAQKLKADS